MFFNFSKNFFWTFSTLSAVGMCGMYELNSVWPGLNLNMFQLWWWLVAKVLKKGLKKVWPQWNCCWLMEQDFVRYLICQWIDGNIHKRAPLHVEEETAILRPSHVLSSPVAPGSRHTPWGNRVMGTLPGSRPGVVCGSWGVSLWKKVNLTLGPQRNC